MPSSYRSPAVGVTFRQFLNGFVQTDELPFRDVLTTTQIEQAAAAENVAFGTGAAAVYSVPVTLWAFIAQVVSDQKSCLAAVARVLVLLTILGRKPCDAGTGAYCKARAKLPERFLQRLTCDVGRQLEEEAPDSWRWHGHRVGNRPDRCEPRKVNRRTKGYSRMLKPRAQERAACLNG
jgi:hypothetical protein